MPATKPMPRGFLSRLAAIAIPLVALAAFMLASGQRESEQQMRAELARHAAQSAADIRERLSLAEAGLGMTIATRPHRMVTVPNSGDLAAEYFSDIAVLGPEGHAAASKRDGLKVPPLSAAVRKWLDRHAAVMLLNGDESGHPGVFLLKKLPAQSGDGWVAAAAVKPEFLWRGRGGTGLVTRVLDADGRLLYASDASASPASAHFDASRLLTQTGDVDWREQGKRFFGSSAPIPLAQRFNLADWTVIVGREAPEIPIGASAASGLAVALGLALLAAAWLGRPGTWRQGRTRATIGEEAVDATVARHGYHGSMAQTEHPAATEQRALRGLAQIDQAILSHASADRIIEIAMRSVTEVSGCDLVAVSRLERESEFCMRTLSRIGSGTLNLERHELRSSLVPALTRRPEGLTVEDPSGYPFLARLASTGARSFVLLPAYCDGRLAAILGLGRLQGPPLTAAPKHAREFASRLGVALTLAARAEEAHFLGRFESVTCLPNRRYFRARLSAEISRATREDRSLVLLYIDLDQFKRVNDGAGHDVGDAVLKEAAARLRSKLRKEDMLAHFGGDEFVVLLPAQTDAADAGRVAEKLIALLSAPFCIDGEIHNLSASIGITMFPDDGRSAEALLQNADAAMSRAKKSGRSQYIFFEEETNAKLREQFALESELRTGLAQGELVLHYQPQLDVRSGKLIGAEGLVRWQHPRRGLLAPAVFIELAEDCGLIDQIGEHTRQLACAQYQTWQASGLAIDRISVNVAGSELRRRDFIPKLKATMSKSGIQPFALEIEITESTLVSNSDQVLSALTQLRERGIRVAIDDFGTGYSSLSYLKRLPFDMLKIDRSFIADIGAAEDSDSRAVASAVLGIAHSLGKEVCAEGVETEPQSAFLVDHGCELIQGYLIARPMPAQEFEAFVRGWVSRPSVRPRSNLRSLAA